MQALFLEIPWEPQAPWLAGQYGQGIMRYTTTKEEVQADIAES